MEIPINVIGFIFRCRYATTWVYRTFKCIPGERVNYPISSCTYMGAALSIKCAFMTIVANTRPHESFGNVFNEKVANTELNFGKLMRTNA